MEENKKKALAIAIVAVLVVVMVVALLIYQDNQDNSIDEEFPENGSIADVSANGTFQDGAHPTSGKALLIHMDTKFVLRFEDFKTDDGPGLYVYLSIDKGDEDYVNLGKLKGVEGNMNYDVPAGTNTSEYNHVLIWCEPFGVLFGHAVLET